MRQNLSVDSSFLSSAVRHAGVSSGFSEKQGAAAINFGTWQSLSPWPEHHIDAK